MAKFSACYQLCPLIDQKGFLGVTDESINGCVIITLGKNMVIRYKVKFFFKLIFKLTFNGPYRINHLMYN